MPLRQTNRTELSAAYAYMAFAFGVIFAGDLITVLIFWELMALGSATVIFASGTEAARRAGLRYLAVHLFGGVLLMAGGSRGSRQQRAGDLRLHAARQRAPRADPRRISD